MNKTVFRMNKADLPLKEDESVSEFTDRLHKWIASNYGKLDLPEKADYMWIAELYKDNLVLSVSIKREGLIPIRDLYYRMTWVMKGDDFVLGKPEEVIRQTTWIPKSKVRKAQENLWKDIL